MALPLQKTDLQALSLLQTSWKAQLDPVLANVTNRMSVIKDVKLASGVNVINHKLGRVQQGWVISDITGIASIYRSAPLNDLTLTLTSSAPVTISLIVF